MAFFSDSGIRLSKWMVLLLFFLMDGYRMVDVVAATSKTAAGNTVTESAASSALAVLGIIGNLIAIINFSAPIFTFVMPVWKERSVGDRMVYGSLLAFLNNLMWAMYAASGSLHSKLFFFIVSGMGFVFQISYAIVYIYFAEGKKGFKALVLLSVSSVVAIIMVALVSSEVMTQRWSGTWVDVLAAASAVSIHIFSAYDMVMVMKSKQIIYIDRIITPFTSVLAACIWTGYGFISSPVNFYVVVPNLVGILSTAVQTAVYSYLIYCKTQMHSVQADDAVDNNYNMGKLSSPV